MIKKILIANRGEIASRIIRTCKIMNIKTVAVYSEADTDAPFVPLADESFLLGPSQVNESYLNINKILSIAKEAKVDAIHPGYGFLSENGSFASQVKDAGFIFIGPNPRVIEQMGDKIAARKLMKAAGIPVIPGTDGVVNNEEEALTVATKIGYPIMLKAAAGGGGIGMQVVNSDQELVKAFESNSKRAKSFFGNGAMFMERKLTPVRHIEVQLLADKQGNVVHLFDRECSIQRRNQKVIEEAPSPFLSNETREEMGKVAVKAAKEIKYENAGTVEFLVDSDENFYFLEMNTRIQVEHPVTEEITGIDIVKVQIEIANGENLSVDQADLQLKGHAIEVRIYAEDPQTFFPCPGLIKKYKVPESAYIRNETAIKENYNVTPFYDPMISKLVIYGDNRTIAIQRLQAALSNYQIEGIKTNIPMLKDVIANEHFMNQNTPTDFLKKYYLPTL